MRYPCYVLLAVAFFGMLPLASGRLLHVAATYYDDRYKFSIDPPSGWTVKKTDVTVTEGGVAEIIVMFLGPIENQLRININIAVEAAPFPLTPEEYWVDFAKAFFLDYFPDTEFISEGPRELAGMPAYESVKAYTYQGLELKGKQVVIVRDTSVFAFTYTAGPDSYEKHLDAFEQSLATFKFEEEAKTTVTPPVTTETTESTPQTSPTTPTVETTTQTTPKPTTTTPTFTPTTSTTTTTSPTTTTTSPAPAPAPSATLMLEIAAISLAVVIPISAWMFSRRRRSRLRVLMRNVESTFRRFKSDESKCEVALLLVREEAQRDLEDGRLTAEQFAVIDKRLDEYLKELRNAH